jgi:protein gp37
MSKIEWTNDVWNPITGCTKKSEGCKNCYACTMHKRLTGMKLEKYKFPFENVIFHYEELNRKLKQKSRMYFVNSMSDTFHDKISGEQINKILIFCNQYQQHIFQILTKRAERITNFYYPNNVWLGVTVESSKYKNRIDYLKKTNAKIKFLSCEPLLDDLGKLDLKGIDWVIVGGESGINARPCHYDWVQNIQKQCEKQHVSFFFKQWGEWQDGSNGYNTKNNIVMLNNGDCLKYPEYCERGILKYLKENNHFADSRYWWSLNPRAMAKVGKKKAGSLLDGKEYKQFPEVIND